MKAVIGPRKELGMRTVFNILGPLTNPAGANAQVVGVYDAELVGLVARALANLDVERALVVHGSGMDEIALHDETHVAELRGDRIEEYSLEPSDIGLERYSIEAVSGGTPEANASDLEAIVEGTMDGAKREIILANAGAAIYVAGRADTHEAGVEIAREAIDSGDAAQKLETMQAGPAE